MDLFLELIRDYGEFLVGIIAVIIGWYWWKNEGQRKRIEYQIISNFSVFDINDIKDEFKKDIEILYKKESIKNLRLIIIRFKNTGTLPVLKTDFDSPIEILSNLVGWDTINTYPKNLKIKLMSIEQPVQDTLKVKGISIEPILINPKESFKLRLLTRDSNSELNIKGRIIGLSEIKKSNNLDWTFWDSPLTGILANIASFLLFISFLSLYSSWGFDSNITNFKDRNGEEIHPFIVFFIMMSFIIVMIPMILVSEKRSGSPSILRPKGKI